MAHGRFDNPIVAALAGFWDLFRKQEKEDRLKATDSFAGKTVLITGANSGLGFGIAVEIAKRGGHIIMACRSQIPESGELVKKITSSQNVEMRFVDLSKIDSIHQFVDGLIKDKIKLDITILNAGVALPKARKTESGMEEMFMVNYLSNVILTNLLLNGKVIENSKNKSEISPRIIFISSDSHQGSSAIDYNEFGVYCDYGPSKGISNYSYFKLILNTYATELSRKINRDQVNVGVNVICPGPVHSNIIKEAPLMLRIALGSIFKIIFRSPAKAALPVVFMAISDDFNGKTNEYMHMFRQKLMDPKIYLPEEGKKLWDESAKLWKQIDKNADIIREII